MVHQDFNPTGLFDVLPADMLAGLLQSQLANTDPAQLAQAASDAYMDWATERHTARNGGFFQGTIGIRIVEAGPNGAARVGQTIKTPDAVQGIVLGILASLGADVTPDLFPSDGAMDAAASLTGYRS